jgi:hypothetical protein
VDLGLSFGSASFFFLVVVVARTMVSSESDGVRSFSIVEQAARQVHMRIASKLGRVKVMSGVFGRVKVSGVVGD